MANSNVNCNGIKLCYVSGLICQLCRCWCVCMERKCSWTNLHFNKDDDDDEELRCAPRVQLHARSFECCKHTQIECLLSLCTNLDCSGDLHSRCEFALELACYARLLVFCSSFAATWRNLSD